MFHKYVCNDRGKGGSHGRAFSLFITLALVAKKGGFWADLNYVSNVRVDKFTNDLYGCLDRIFCKKGNDIKTN